MRRFSNGEIAPGSPLPSERALAEEFEVGRTSVREAIQGLVSLGVIERRGNGTFVTERMPEINLSPADDRKERVRLLFETRRVLELPISELAGFRATSSERDQISALAQLFRDDLSLVEFRLLDRQFHATVAGACDNPLLVELYGKVLEALFQSEAFHSLLFDRANQDGVARIIAESGRQHRAIAAALLTGNPVSVLAASEAHLRSVEAQMVDDLV